MQIGKLKPENAELLEEYSRLGFSNKTNMVDNALDLLRERIKKEKRQQARAEMLDQYAASFSENFFADIDGDEIE